jgi:hypothetical protein
MGDEFSAWTPLEHESERKSSCAAGAFPDDILWQLRLLDEFQVAHILNLRVSILRRRRSRGLPPIFVRLSGQIRYRPADLVTFVNSMKNSPQQGPEQA